MCTMVAVQALDFPTVSSFPKGMGNKSTKPSQEATDDSSEIINQAKHQAPDTKPLDKLAVLTNPDGSPSPCAVTCAAQQQALVDCVNEIRDDPDNEKTKACLKPAANAWMTCCAEANTLAGAANPPA